MSKYTIGEAAKHSNIPKSHLLAAIAQQMIAVEYRHKKTNNHGGCEAETLIDRKELDRFSESYFSPDHDRFSEREDKPVPSLPPSKEKQGKIRKEIERRLEERWARKQEDYL